MGACGARFAGAQSVGGTCWVEENKASPYSLTEQLPARRCRSPPTFQAACDCDQLRCCPRGGGAPAGEPEQAPRATTGNLGEARRRLDSVALRRRGNVGERRGADGPDLSATRSRCSTDQLCGVRGG